MCLLPKIEGGWSDPRAWSVPSEKMNTPNLDTCAVYKSHFQKWSFPKVIFPTKFKKRKTLQINAPKSLFQNEPKFLYIILDFWNKFLKTWSWTSWQKLEKRSFEAAFWRMNVEAFTFDWVRFISLGFGRGGQVGETSLLNWLYYGASVGRIRFLFGTLQALGSHQIPRSLEEDGAFFYNAKQR